MSGSKTIGGINVVISATTDKFVKSIGIARRALTGFGKAVKNFIFSMKGLAVAFATGALVKFTANAAEAIDSLAKTADRLNITTEALAGLQLAADEAGISHQLLEKALTMMVRNTADATRGVGEAALAYKQMGINANELHKLSPDKQFLVLAEAISKVNNKQTQLAMTADIFGARAKDMITLIRGGRSVLDEAAQAAVSLGLAIDRKTAAGVERAIDAFGRFKFAVSGIFRSLMAEIAPFIELLSNKATDFLATNGRGKGIGSMIGNVIIEMAKNVADSIQKMVQGVLGFISDAKALFLQFRLDAPGWMGVGFKGQADKAAAFASFDKSRKAYGRSLGWESPSAMIDRTMADYQKQAAAQVADAPGVSSRSIFSRGRDFLSGIMGSNNARTAKDIGGQLWGGIAGAIRSVPGMINSAQWAGMQFAGNNFKGPGVLGDRPALSFAESGSADSYRQQAAIRRQSEGIAKQQLGVQKEIRDGINKMADAPPMRPANFKG